MSLIVSPWLPAAPRADLEVIIRLVAESWLAEWIVGPVCLNVVTLVRVDPDVRDWRGLSGSWLHMTKDDLVGLGMAACNGRADRINPVDQRLLEQVGKEMLDDLVARLGSGAETTIAPDFARPGDIDFDVMDGAKHRFRVTLPVEGSSLLVALDENAAVRLRKADAGSSRVPVLVSLTTALAVEKVRLGCHLGCTVITAAELSALAAGDVLVLDRRVDAPVPLMVDADRPRAGKARIGAQVGSIEVTLIEAIDLKQEN